MKNSNIKKIALQKVPILSKYFAGNNQFWLTRSAFFRLPAQGRVRLEAGLHGEAGAGGTAEAGPLPGPERAARRADQAGSAEGRLLRQQPHRESPRHRRRPTVRPYLRLARTTSGRHRRQQRCDEVRKVASTFKTWRGHDTFYKTHQKLISGWTVFGKKLKNR